GRFLPIDEAVVAERALVRGARIRHVHVRGLAIPAVGGRVDRAVVAAFDDAEGAAGHAGPAAVADIVLYDDGVEFGAEERSRRAYVEAAGMSAVLAHVRGHQPAEVRGVRRGRVDAGEVIGVRRLQRSGGQQIDVHLRGRRQSGAAPAFGGGTER